MQGHHRDKMAIVRKGRKWLSKVRHKITVPIIRKDSTQQSSVRICCTFIYKNLFFRVCVHRYSFLGKCLPNSPRPDHVLGSWLLVSTLPERTLMVVSRFLGTAETSHATHPLPTGSNQQKIILVWAKFKSQQDNAITHFTMGTVYVYVYERICVCVASMGTLG